MLRLPSLVEIRAERQRRSTDEAVPQDQRPEAVKERCKTLAGFVKEAWHVLEPGKRLSWGWHQQAICDHLEAITWGTFLKMGFRNRLLINVPPGSMKSLLVSVFWQAWEWYIGFPANRFLATSYGPGPVDRDNLKFQLLVHSDWYQALNPTRFARNATDEMVNTSTGSRMSTPFASLTSLRGDRLVLDDPHSTESAESENDRDKTTRKFREGALNRLNDQEISAIVVIMQRLHAKDLSGVIERDMKGYIHLMLPMEFEPDRRCKTPIFTDPRKKDGELLDPVRFPAEAVELIKVEMGSFAYAGQYQQRPSPREGALFKRQWFEGKMRRVAPEGTRWVRHWDLAASVETRSDRSAGVKLGIAPDKSYWIAHSKVMREEGHEVRRVIKAIAETDGKQVVISLPQDPGQAGKVQARDFVAGLAGWIVRTAQETGDKYTRAEPFSVQCEAGNVYYLEGDWNEAYLDELCEFPAGQHDDQVDATSGAFGRLISATSGKILIPLMGTAARTFFGDHPDIRG